MIIIKLAHTHKLWIIRHCDKPSNDRDPCCSDKGYERSINWVNFFNKYLQKQEYIKIYTSGFREKNNYICDANEINSFNISSTKKCQKSQRMIITSEILYDSLKNNSYDKITLDNKYCIGDEKQLYMQIMNDYNNNRISNSIVVWEHLSIIDLIHKFDIQITKWKKEYKKYYSIVFIIDIKNKKLDYLIYNYETNIIYQDNKISNWIYGNKYDNNYGDFMIEKNNDNNFILLLFVFMLIVFLLVIIYIFYKFCIKSKTQINEYKYIEIK